MRILNWLWPSALFSIPAKEAQVRVERHSCYLTKKTHENGKQQLCSCLTKCITIWKRDGEFHDKFMVPI